MIIGIDPGPEMIAWTAVSRVTGAIVAWDHQLVADFLKDCLRLSALDAAMAEAALMAIEMPMGHAMSTRAKKSIKEGDIVRSAAPSRDLFTTARIVGHIEAACARRTNPLPTRLYARATIRGHLDAKNDTSVRAALRERYCRCGSKGACKKGCPLHGMNNDVRAALAVATAVVERPALKEW